MSWRTAKSLDTLLHQVNTLYPGRDKSNDGTIGDEAHQHTNSDHNPDEYDVVQAMDITHDPAHGLNARALAESLVTSRDPRIDYVISNRQICSSTISPWKWRSYTGTNPHEAHMHLSVADDPNVYDDPRLWDLGAKVIPAPTTSRPTLRIGSQGSQVCVVQTCLRTLPVDGDFGSITEAGVKDFQHQAHLVADGIVGPQTWAALDHAYRLPPYPPPMVPWFTRATIDRIVAVAQSSTIARYEWDDRGHAPAGYINGMAVAFAYVAKKLEAGDSSAREMAKADTHDDDTDALSWYAVIFNDLGMNNNVSGIDTLRHLFVLQLGLGMRESSGEFCCGRDMSADNVEADTCEAGAFQMSWNASGSSSELQKLMDTYAPHPEQCALTIFDDGVSCSSNDWSCYGSGAGFDYQVLAKSCPQFAVETTAVILRNLRQHWGPINRHEVEVRPEADSMFRAVQAIIKE